MRGKVNTDKTYVPVEELLAKEIQGEFIIIPLFLKKGTAKDSIFRLNETGKAIWDKINNGLVLKDIISQLSLEFNTSAIRIESDVIGLVSELVKRGMVVEAK